MTARYIGTETLKLADLTPFPGNARRGNIDELRTSLRVHGQFRMLLVRVDGDTRTVLAGNQTLEAMLAEGHDTGRCELIECDDREATQINLADNRLSDIATDDHDALVELLQFLDGDFEGSGWSADDLDAFLTPLEPGAGGSGEGDGGSRPSLADRFLIPPFDTLDARSGWWRTRKTQWLSLGFTSEVGRDGGLVHHGKARRDPAYYAKKSAAEKRIGRTITVAEFEADYYEADNAIAGGTSIFDPVLCELAYRWFSPVGGTVIDPFAGGSVRGLVAAILGRHYRGNDLSTNQIAANRIQAAQFAERGLVGTTPEPAPSADVAPGDLTPVERRGAVWVKRDDMFVLHGSAGGKVRSCLALATQPGVTGLVTAGSRQSPQVNIVAGIAAALNLPCRVHVPKAAELTPELAAARAAGAEIVEHHPGYNNVIISRARKDAAERGWANIPFGMECDAAVEQTAGQVANIPAGARRIVIPVGSGMSLAGVLAGLRAAGRTTPILGVTAGADPSERLDKYAPGWRDQVTLVDSGVDYHRHATETDIDGIALDPVYEAKCLPFLQDDDLLWVVGCRETARGDKTARPAPVWTTGESAEWLATVEPESADMIFTCPPYYDLEVYGDNPDDLSNMTYAAYDAAYTRILTGAARALRRDRFAVIVVGDARDSKGHLHDLRGATIRAADAAGLAYVNGAVLITPLGSVPVVAARAFTATRTLSRTHQDVLVFVKGDRHRATKACGEIDVHIPAELLDHFDPAADMDEEP